MQGGQSKRIPLTSPTKCHVTFKWNLNFFIIIIIIICLLHLFHTRCLLGQRHPFTCIAQCKINTTQTKKKKKTVKKHIFRLCNMNLFPHSVKYYVASWIDLASTFKNLNHQLIEVTIQTKPLTLSFPLNLSKSTLCFSLLLLKIVNLFFYYLNRLKPICLDPSKKK